MVAKFHNFFDVISQLIKGISCEELSPNFNFWSKVLLIDKPSFIKRISAFGDLEMMAEMLDINGSLGLY